MNQKDIISEIISALFADKTINQLKTLRNEVLFEVSGMTFRLLKVEKGKGNVNLELYCRDDNGLYWKPIGFYILGSSFNNIEKIVIIKEFESAYKNLYEAFPMNLVEKVDFLSLEENIYIALASRDVSNVVKAMFQNPSRTGFPSMENARLLMSNGFEVVVRDSMAGTLEAILNESVEEAVDDIFVMYRNDSNGIVAVCSEPTYQKLYDMKLLSAFK